MFETDPTLVVSWSIALVTDVANTIALAGPPSDLPGPVPDFVGDVLESIRSFTGGDGDGRGLGEALRSLTPGGS